MEDRDREILGRYFSSVLHVSADHIELCPVPSTPRQGPTGDLRASRQGLHDGVGSKRSGDHWDPPSS